MEHLGLAKHVVVTLVKNADGVVTGVEIDVVANDCARRQVVPVVEHVFLHEIFGGEDQVDVDLRVQLMDDQAQGDRDPRLTHCCPNLVNIYDHLTLRDFLQVVREVGVADLTRAGLLHLHVVDASVEFRIILVVEGLSFLPSLVHQLNLLVLVLLVAGLQCLDQGLKRVVETQASCLMVLTNVMRGFNPLVQLFLLDQMH